MRQTPGNTQCVETSFLQSYFIHWDFFKPTALRSPQQHFADKNLGKLLTLVAIYVWFGTGSCAHAQIVPRSTTDPSQAVSDPPDIIFVISDDQGWNDYSFMGHPHIRTPHIDRLAQESLLFTRGYVPDSLCRPSLATIISGLYPHQHGIVGNDPPPSSPQISGRARSYTSEIYQRDLEQFLTLHIDRMNTLPDRLKPLGYTSFQTGKWWEGNPSRGGFDSGMTHGDFKRGGRHGDQGLEIGRSGLKPVEEFVRKSRQADRPYFLWYAPFLPHAPHTPPEELLNHYRSLAPTEPIAKYWAMCEWFDQTIGELRRIVDSVGRPKNTLIVYVCDNGWINLPHVSAFAPKSKRSPYDGGIRTPIMLHWPDQIAPQRDDQHLACSIDLIPSVSALLGLNADDSLPGINLTNSTQLSGRDELYGEIFEHDIQSMDDPRSSLLYRWIISGHRKLIIPDPMRLPDAQIELYDLQHDPTEDHNLASENAVEVQRLTNKVDRWWP